MLRGDTDVTHEDYEGQCRTIAYRSLEATSDVLIQEMVKEVTGEG